MQNCQTYIYESLRYNLIKEEINLGTEGYRLIDEDKDVKYDNESVTLRLFISMNKLEVHLFDSNVFIFKAPNPFGYPITGRVIKKTETRTPLILLHILPI